MSLRYDRRLGQITTPLPESKPSLGPTIADTEAALGQYDEEPWQMVDHYLGHHRMGESDYLRQPQPPLKRWPLYDYVYYGPATDSLGRVGEAFSVTRHFPGYTQEYRLVINPADGTLLAESRSCTVPGSWGQGTTSSPPPPSSLPRECRRPDPCDETPGCEARQEG